VRPRPRTWTLLQSADKSVLAAAAMNDATLMPAGFQLQVGLPSG